MTASAAGGAAVERHTNRVARGSFAQTLRIDHDSPVGLFPETVSFCGAALGQEEVIVNQKLYVGNLPYTTTDQELQDLFAQHGAVQSATVVTDRYTGQSRGFGFVEMGSGEAAQQAIAALHDSAFQGRNLVVNEARPKGPSSRPSGF